MKKVFLRTLGCQMNVRDSELISGILSKAGYEICENDQESDIVIFNTCSVRKQAEDRVWSLIGSYKGSKIIGLAGCMAQNYKENAFNRDKNIKFLVGPQDIHKIAEILDKLTNQTNLFERKIWELDSKERLEEIYHSGFYGDKKHAYVIISEGCSNFCSYCIVPHVRGPLRHRKNERILEEIRQATEKGISNFTLLGQNVNAYHDGDSNFVNLLVMVNNLNGIKQFNFFTSHPKDVKTDLFKAIRDLDKLFKTLHLPLQSGSDRTLKLMNRGYDKKEYIDLVKKYRKIVKGGLLTTDIIVGFPGETKEDFLATFDMVKEIRFNAAYIFKYSPRPGTQAATMADNVKPKEKEARHRLILDLQRNISNRLNKKT